jgi:hypothetical protein
MHSPEEGQKASEVSVRRSRKLARRQPRPSSKRHDGRVFALSGHYAHNAVQVAGALAGDTVATAPDHTWPLMA